MKRKIAIISSVTVLILLVFLLFFTGGKGNTSHCERIIVEGATYPEKEIHHIMDLVEETFRSEFSGCYLIELKYDEALSNLYNAEWIQQYHADHAIILTSVFDVGSSGGDGSLNPNSTYSNWQWILTKTGQNDWVLQTWGY